MQYRPLTRENVQFKITYTKTLLNSVTKLRLKFQHIVSWVNIFKKIYLLLKLMKYCSKTSWFER